MKNIFKSELIFEIAKGIRNSKGFQKKSSKLKFDIEESVFHIVSDDVAKKLDREKGTYYCLNFDDVTFYNSKAKDYLSNRLSNQISNLAKLKKIKTNKVLVVGLGNSKYACDSLGARVVDKVLITKPYLDKNLYSKLQMSEIYCISMGVYGTTGLDSSEVIKAICQYLKPDLVIAIDSMITADKERLAKSVQLSDTKLLPGGGVGNARKEISFDAIGVPVFAIGVPLVVNTQIFGAENDNLIVTPKDVESKVKFLSSVVANAINLTFTSISKEELSELCS